MAFFTLESGAPWHRLPRDNSRQSCTDEDEKTPYEYNSVDLLRWPSTNLSCYEDTGNA